MAKNVSKRGKGWQANLMLNGKRYRPTFTTEEAAITWVSQARLAAELGNPIPEAATEVTKGGGRITTMQDLLDITIRDKWSRMKSSKILILNGTAFVEWIGPNKLITEVTEEDIYNYLEHRRVTRGNSDATLNRNLAAIKVMMGKAHDKRIIPHIPVVKNFKERVNDRASDYLDFGEEDAILSHLKHRGMDALYDFVIVALDTGGRRGEILNLTSRQIGPTSVRFEFTKNGSFRTIPLTKRAREAFARRKLHSSDPKRPFADIESGRWATDQLRAIYDHLGGRYTNILQPCHIFRHSCASRLAIKGVDANRIKEWMDHASLQTTERYMKLSPRALDEVVNFLEQEPANHLKVVK